jgi:CHAT domain-containing protein/Tfp pilus assembly protein PilF
VKEAQPAESTQSSNHEDREIEAAERALASCEEKLARDHLEVAAALDALATLLRNRRELEKAGQLHERALGIRERELGPDHLDVAASLHELAIIHLQLRDTAAAEPLCERALRIRERAQGPVAASLAAMGSLHFLKGNYVKAAAFYERALSTYEQAPDSDPAEVARVLMNFAGVLNVQGAYANASELLERAARILESTLGPEHRTVGAVSYNRAVVHYDLGEYAKAEPLFENALKIIEQCSGTEDLDLLMPLNSLSMLYRVQGAYEKAKSVLERALRIAERAGPKHPRTADCVANLAAVHYAEQKYAEAEQLFQQALQLREATLEPDHSDIATTLTNLGLVHIASGSHARALPLCEKAVRLFEAAHDPDNPDVADGLENLAGLYEVQRVYDTARSLHARVLGIRERVLGPQHPDVADALDNLAAVRWATNDIPGALECYERAAEIRERYLGSSLATLSESRMRMLLDISRGQMDTLVSFQAHTDSSAARNLALTTVLRRKGRTVGEAASARAALRRHLPTTLQRDLEVVEKRRTELATRRMAAEPQEPEALEELELEAEKLETSLARESARFRAHLEPLTLQGVQAHIPEDGALVEFVRYRRFDPGDRRQPWHEARYLAFVVRRHGAADVVPLGEAAPIESAIQAALGALVHPGDDYHARLRALEELVFAPVRRAADARRSATQRFLISPDGHLHLVPFAALVDVNGRHLVEHTSITYVSSGRDLVPVERDAPRSRPLVVAAPDYEGRCKPLPGTKAEAKALSEYFKDIDLFEGPLATKHVLSRARAPMFVHVATHGFFRGSNAPSFRRSRSWRGQRDLVLPSSDPLRLPDLDVDVDGALDGAGLIFAGATEAEATLTAREVASIDLDGTQLVVLSACETGVGQIASSEGVYGLRRAFAIAGAQTQVVSLWKVDDDATRELMSRYYGALCTTERSKALQLAQQALHGNSKYRHPYYWAAFVPIGDARPLELVFSN